MQEVIIVVRDVGSLKPDYSLKFRLPEVPKVGSYISIHRPDKPQPYGEDMIVRQVWWRLEHPETRPASDVEKIGQLIEIFVECDPAVGPYASDNWHDMYEAGVERGQVEKFEVARYSVRESEMKLK